MVLQRDRPLPVWGWCEPGATATVRLGAARADARADAAGRWMAVLPPQPAAGPLTLEVAADGEKTRLADVWLGEVWLASGQSNMEMAAPVCPPRPSRPRCQAATGSRKCECVSA